MTRVVAPFDAPGCLGRVGSRPSDPATAIAAPRTDTNLGFRIFDAKRYVGVFLADIASRRTIYAPWNEPATRLDAIVCGSVAVTRDGRRCGKGEGYSDLEFAILRELGHPPVPVATTVHDLQVVDSVPRDPTDQPLSVIATPTHAIRIKRPSAAPTGIDWTRLSAEDLEEMPILAELKRMTTSNA